MQQADIWQKENITRNIVAAGITASFPAIVQMLNRLRGKTKEMVTISRKIKVTFFSAILFGIIDHMFALVNECPHSDVFWAYFGYGAGYTSGRWGLALLGDAINTWFGNYPIPWLYGMCSILFFGSVLGMHCRSFGDFK